MAAESAAAMPPPMGGSARGAAALAQQAIGRYHYNGLTSARREPADGGHDSVVSCLRLSREDHAERPAVKCPSPRPVVDGGHNSATETLIKRPAGKRGAEERLIRPTKPEPPSHVVYVDERHSTHAKHARAEPTARAPSRAAEPVRGRRTPLWHRRFEVADAANREEDREGQPQGHLRQVRHFPHGGHRACRQHGGIRGQPR